MLMQLYMYWQMYSNFPLGEWTACMTIFYYPATQAPIHCLQNVTRWLLEVLLYVHRNHRFIRDGSPGRPPWLSHSSWAPHIIHQLVDIMYYATAHWNIYIYVFQFSTWWMDCTCDHFLLPSTCLATCAFFFFDQHQIFFTILPVIWAATQCFFGEGQCIK